MADGERDEKEHLRSVFRKLDPFDTPQKAFAEAERLIAEAQFERATELTFKLDQLTRLPMSIKDLANLQTLIVFSTKLASLAPITDLKSLRLLALYGCNRAIQFMRS